jgi:hypothetical protein
LHHSANFSTAIAMHFLYWFLGFGLFWVGLKLFDDEIILIASAIVGSILILAGLTAAPTVLQIPVEAIAVITLFNVCMQCIKRGDRA